MPFTILTWYGARRAHKPLHELVRFALTDRPTLLALVSDKFTQESHIRPFRPLAERFGERLHVLLCAEWEPPYRQRDGEQLFRALGVPDEVRPRLLSDEGEGRCALFLRQKQPQALVDLYFVERGSPMDNGLDDGREPFFLAREETAAREVERLLVRPFPTPAATAAQAQSVQSFSLFPAPRPGTHDFGAASICRACGDSRLSLRACPGKPKDEGPARDRFELIELE